MNFKGLFLSGVLSLFLVTGCASMAVGEDALTQRTSVALGLAPDQFTISNRSDSGVRTDYSVRTASGKIYSCYVTGTVTVIGKTVSDAVCTETQSGASQGQAAAAGTCNDLLRAAGKCK